MAEIKSAIELAMEKTKGLRLSQEEMEHLQEEEMQTKAHGLVNRFLEVDFHFKEVEKELARFSSNQRKELEGLMIQYLGEALQLDKDNELIFQGIETLREGKKRGVQRMPGSGKRTAGEAGTPRHFRFGGSAQGRRNPGVGGNLIPIQAGFRGAAPYLSRRIKKMMVRCQGEKNIG